MKLEQDVQNLSKRGEQLEQLPSLDTEEFDEHKNRGLNLRPLWRTIQRNVLLITGTTTVVASVALFSGLNSPRIYEGGFRLLVEPITSEAKFTDPSVISRDGGVATNNGSSVDYPTLLQFLQSPGLLSGIIIRIQTQYPEFSYDAISRNLVVQRVGTNLSDSTKLIEVRYKGKDPKKVQFVLEELAKGYLKYSLEDRKTRISGGVQFIEDQLPGLQQQVDNLQSKVQTLKQRYKLSDPATDAAALSTQLREIQAQKLQTQRELSEQKTLYVNLQNQLKLTPNEAIPALTLSQDPRYQELLGQVKQIQSQIAVESVRFSEESPVIQALREKQKNLSLLLKQETKGILGQDLPSQGRNPQVLTFQNTLRQELIEQMVDTANQVQVLEVRDRAVAQTEANLNQQVRQFPAIVRQYNDLQRQLEIATSTLNQLLVQRETLRVEVAQKEVPWELVSLPNIARDPAGNPIPVPGNTAKKLAMGVIAGFVLGLGAAMLREKHRNVFYTAEDIQDALELPILGLTPFDENAEQFANSEAFDSLYANIRFIASDPSVHSLVVCSAAPGDGKTTIALHLAQAAAAAGQRVLLVDANLRVPQLHTKLSLPNLQGLSNLLSQELNPNALIQRSPQEENLFVLTAGQLLPGSTKLLASNQMQHLMEQFQGAFDLVIYDTPHLVEFADANFLAAHTDGILMVVGVGKTKRSAVMQALEKLNSWRLPILGIVANHVKPSTNSSYDYHNDDYEQNHPARSTFENQPILKTDY